MKRGEMLDILYDYSDKELMELVNKVKDFRA
jgi:hypothetical protein